MIKNKLFLLLIFVVAFMTSCVTPKDTNYLQDIDYPTTGDVAPVDYLIIPGDQLILKVFTLNEDMKILFSMFISEDNRTLTDNRNNNNMYIQNQGLFGSRSTPNNVLNVASDGTVNIPFVGLLEVKGLTVLEAKKKIANSFQAFSSDVTVDISLRNRVFYVVGAAGSKTVQMNNLRMNIYQAMSQIGNVDMYANRKQVRILRQTSDGTEVKTFDLRSKDIVDSEYYYIQPNDVIYMPTMQRRFYGAVTSFTGVFGLLSSIAGIAVLIIKLVR
ncbi:hypothetical protein D0T53_05575 [Dysgonomonas sp. 216]|uniref:polysaccharide biosynthesis/export family protein n=1 Tax=Dysgonomonas sp. 216 TaxID=2302934 RepID=UPI0013D5D103|nr:polysaccharide biosynthesis/export family protein [Dysgonomonas sp. 216]NDW18386.1 hypothetical protein [Dysgonomonas sp. 216]